jgi:flagellar hook-basal body complex protein FliE
MVIKGIDASQSVAGITRPFQQNNGGIASSTGGEGFTRLLGDMVGKVNELQGQADKAIERLATGESKGLHEVMIAMEKSNVSFQFLTQVRNKALDAYHEIMRMQI